MGARGACEVCGVVTELRDGKLGRHFALGQLECGGGGREPMSEAQLARAQKEDLFAPDLRRKVRCPRCRRPDVPVEGGQLVAHRVGRGWPDAKSACEAEGLPVREGVCSGCAADRGFHDPDGRLIHQHCTGRGEDVQSCGCACSAASEARATRSPRWLQRTLF